MSKKEKTDNRKALPKFFGIMLIGALLGGIVGGVTGFFGGTFVPDQFVTKIYDVFRLIGPYGIAGCSILLTILEVRLFGQAKSLFQNWDGEE